MNYYVAAGIMGGICMAAMILTVLGFIIYITAAERFPSFSQCVALFVIVMVLATGATLGLGYYAGQPDSPPFSTIDTDKKC